MTLNLLKQNTINILQQVANLVKQIDDNHYSEQLDLLSKNTIAKHVRHILELYIQLMAGLTQNEINYEKRERNLLLEHNRNYTIDFINDLKTSILSLETNLETVQLRTLIQNDELLVITSLERELVYNIEHAIHHMAIMQIACNHCFKYIVLEKNFGVAYATVQYNNTCAQ
jgi:uncharacterized damage-inducible protein DinB